MKLREATITSDVCQSYDGLHDYLKEALGLPDYYGRNMSALADCLAEGGCSVVHALKGDDDAAAVVHAHGLQPLSVEG